MFRKLPKYVKVNQVVLVWDNGKYYRHAGSWSIDYKFVDDDMVSVMPNSSNFDGKPMVEVSESDWRESNKGFIPEGWDLDPDLDPIDWDDYDEDECLRSCM
jgi:hypothetical protein